MTQSGLNPLVGANGIALEALGTVAAKSRSAARLAKARYRAQPAIDRPLGAAAHRARPQDPLALIAEPTAAAL